MRLEEMRRRKQELGYSFRQLAELSGVPLGTIQKIFTGETKSPRHQTLVALEKVLADVPSENTISYRSIYSERMLEDQLKEPAGIYRVNFRAPAEKKPYNRKSGYTMRADGFIEGPYTYEDYMALPDDYQVEMIYGVFYDLTSPKFLHQMIQSELVYQLITGIRRDGMDCEVVSDMDTRVEKDDKTIVRPDVAVICHPDSSRFREGRIWGAPDLVIEIISPSSRSRDMNQKLKLYRDAGVREYWIIDPRDKIIYQIVYDDKEVLRIHSLDETVAVGISEGKIKINLERVVSH